MIYEYQHILVWRYWAILVLKIISKKSAIFSKHILNIINFSWIIFYVKLFQYPNNLLLFYVITYTNFRLIFDLAYTTHINLNFTIRFKTGINLSFWCTIVKTSVTDISFWNLTLGIAATPPPPPIPSYLWGMTRSPKISRKRGCEIFYKNKGLAKRVDPLKKGDNIWFFYYLNYKAHMDITTS